MHDSVRLTGNIRGIMWYKQLAAVVPVFLFIFGGANCVQTLFKPCEYVIGNEKISLASRVWHIPKNDKVLHYSPCGTAVPECNNKAAVCVTSNNGRDTTYLGDKFRITHDDDQLVILKSVNGTRCSRTQTWTAVVHFRCFQTDQLSPKFSQNDDDECVYHIEMVRADCNIKCTTSYVGNLINLRPLRKEKFVIDSNGTVFGLSLCSPAVDCGGDGAVSACIMRGSEIVPLSAVESQHVVYNEVKDQVFVRGKFKFGLTRRDFYNVEIILKCNFNTPFTEPKYLVPHIQGRNYKFVMESSYGCVIKPTRCIIHDEQNFTYNLTSLYKPTSNWQVRNIPKGQLLLNVCGPLVTSNNFCADTYSQACFLSTGGNENRGSIFKELRASRNSVEATFTDGSVCEENRMLHHSTIVKFVCAVVDKEPVLSRYNNCVSDVLWETTTACPIYETWSKDCRVSDQFSQRNLQYLHVSIDKKHSISSDSFLRYNLCGTLNESCANQRNVSVCLHRGGKEYAIGILNTNLKSVNGQISLTLEPNVAKAETFVPEKLVADFHCDYSAPVDGRYKIGTNFSMNVFTPLACLNNHTVNCKITVDNFEFNLNGLSQLSQNFVIPDKDDPNTKYSINVCRPVLFNPDASCMLDSGICMRNASNPNVKDRFKSLADVFSPTYKNGMLVIENMGQYCDHGENYYSIIRFECAYVEEMPVVMRRNGCKFEFSWRTKHACPKQVQTSRSTRSCEYTDKKSDKRYNFPETVNLNIRADSLRLGLSVCGNKYSKYNQSHVTCEGTYTEIQFLYGEFVSFVLNSSCAFPEFNAVKLVCKLPNGTDDASVFINQTMFVSVELDYLCHKEMAADHENKSTFEKTTQNHKIENEVLKTSVRDTNATIGTLSSKIVVPPRFQNVFSKCTVDDNFNLNELKPFNITSPLNTQYTVNIDGTAENCAGFVCKDGSVQAASFRCPTVSFNHTGAFVLLTYRSEEVCENRMSYVSKIRLACNDTGPTPEILTERDCLVIINYPVGPVVCPLLRTNDASSSKGAVIGAITTSVLFLAFLSGVLVYKKGLPRNCRRKAYSQIDKTVVPVYYKDTQT